MGKYSGKLKTKNPVQHMIDKPEFYGADIERRLRKEYSYHEDGYIKKDSVSIPEAAFRAFIETIGNAYDANSRVNNGGGNARKISVEITRKKVTITNYGSTIDISKGDNGLYIIETMFSVPMSSTNYEENRENVIGTFGFGAKVANTLCRLYSVRAGNKNQRKMYTQKWKNRMSKRYDPVISKYDGSSFVEVSYVIDFDLLESHRYEDEDIGVMVRYCYDVAYTGGMSISVSTPSYDRVFKNISDEAFAESYFGPMKRCITMNSDDNIRMIIGDPETSIKGRVISYCNTMETTEHGLHVDVTYGALCTKLKEFYNDKLPDGAKKITIVPIKNTLCCIVVCKAVNVKLKNASKGRLVSPEFEFNIDDKDVKKLSEWSFMDFVREHTKAQRRKILRATDGKKVKHLPKGLKMEIKDADWAGGKRSNEAIAVLVEGGSASGYTAQFIDEQDAGRLKYGSMCMNGVPPNMFVKRDNYEYLAENVFYTELKSFLGLKEDLDYTVMKNFGTLRYGKIIIMVDQDDDGAHMKGLLYNLFNQLFPSLLNIEGFITCYETPILRLTRGKTHINFYTIEEFKKWKSKNNVKGYKIKYFKGLATSTANDAKDDCKNPRYVDYSISEGDIMVMNCMFDPKQSNLRKELLLSYDDNTFTKPSTNEPLSNFFMRQYMKFMLTTTKRAIPHILTGLKESQSKIAYAASVVFGANNEEMKMSKFIGNAITITGYLRGDSSISEACILMGKNYCGSNNVELISPRGQFGSRGNSGTARIGSRYLYCAKGDLYKYIFRSEDKGVVDEQVDDDGRKIEPKWLLPVLPLQLINGVDGVACGWNSKIPLHEPMSVSVNLISRIDNKEPDTPVPWCRKCLSDSEYDKSEDVYILKSEPRIHYSCKESTLFIADIPPQVKYESVISKIMEMLDEGKISDYRDETNMDNILLIIHGISEEHISELPIFYSRKMSSITLLDAADSPVVYPNIDVMLDEFYKFRLDMYKERKKLIMRRLKDSIKELGYKIKFLDLCISKVIVVDNREENHIFSQMDEHSIPHRIFNEIKYREFTKNNLAIIKKKYDDLKSELAIVKAKHYKLMWRDDIVEFMTAYVESYKAELLVFMEDRLRRLNGGLSECSDSYVAKCFNREIRHISKFVVSECKRLDRSLSSVVSR